MKLEGKAAIVTGAARGIGLACASRLADEGAQVVLADVLEEDGAKAAEALKDDGADVHFVHCDVTEKLDIRNLVANAVDRFGKVDILVNNAGITHGESFLELKEADFDRVLAVNLKGAFMVAQAVARQMVAQLDEEHPPGAIIA